MRASWESSCRWWKESVLKSTNITKTGIQSGELKSKGLKIQCDLKDSRLLRFGLKNLYNMHCENNKWYSSKNKKMHYWNKINCILEE